jgi:Zn2+/Cd2+-exporting ATPase
MKQITIFKQNPKLFLETIAVIFSFVLMIVANSLSDSPISPWLWGVAFAVGGYAKAVEGVVKTIKEKSLNVEFLMIAAALAAFLTGDYAEGAVLIFIFAVSGVLEGFATAQSERALTNLLKIAPKTAILIHNEQETLVEISQLKIGDIVGVKPGQQIPADGVIVRGGATIDQASITGEFSPVQKLTNEQVFAGSLVIDSSIQVKVTKDPRQSVVQKMIDFVAQAQAQKTKSETRIATFEKVYVYFVIALALAVIFITPNLGWLSEEEAFRRGVIVLVVASPCALVASITPAILSTLSHGARRGILIKSGRHLENLLKIKVIAFDKTGTITTGKPKVTNLYLENNISEQEILKVLVNAERNSNHPLAKAIVEHFQNIPAELIEITEIPGRGLQSNYQNKQWQIGRFPYVVSQSFSLLHQQANTKGETVVDLILEGELVAFVTLKDTIRKDAIDAVAQIKQLNIIPLLLTGDNQETAQAIAKEIGIEDYFGNCFPEDKVRHLEAYKQKGLPTLMIGDGINDAPSLAMADLGVAMGDGTDVSLETADIVMMNNNLANIPYLFRLTQRMQRIVRQNVIFSMLVITVLLLANIGGFIVLRYGVVSHELSTIIVIINSLRLLKTHKKKV